MTKLHCMALGTGLFIVGGELGVWGGQLFAWRQTAQQDVLSAYALFGEADSAMAQGQTAAAQTWATQGMGSLQVAVTPLSRLGLSNAGTVVPYLNRAQYDVLHHRATIPQRAVLATFRQSMAPFRRESYGHIPQAAFRSAWNRVAAKIGRDGSR